MPCCGKEKDEKISATHKWDYINLSDFKATSCFTPLSYIVLYIALLISIAVYLVDIFIAYNLLLFNRWAGQIDPDEAIIDFRISRWIFTGCIILSLVLLAYRWFNAIRAIRTGGIAQSYLDPLAVRLQSIRMGKRGRGWRRFLVFAELTKSKKGAEYIALFTYFSFEAWLRIIFAEGPRKVINAMTLYTIMTNAHIIPGTAPGQSNAGNSAGNFFENIRTYIEDDNMRAAVVFSMLFSLVIWVLAALSLIASCILYLIFLWHHIPAQDGSIRRYCKRKIDGRLQKIIDAKINKALAKEESRMGFQTNKEPGLKKQPTIPVLGTDKDPSVSLTRKDTKTSYITESSVDTDLERQNHGNDMQKPPFLSRTQTASSNVSNYSSNIPLVGAASAMGSSVPGRPYSPAPSYQSDNPRPGKNLSHSTEVAGYPGQPNRPGTAASNFTYDTREPTVPQIGSGDGIGREPSGRFTPGPLSRQGTDPGFYSTNDSYGSRPLARHNNNFGAFSRNDRSSPGQEFEMRAQTPRAGNQPPPAGFVAYHPTMTQSRTPALSSSQSQRNFTAPPPRSYTASPSRSFSTPAQYSQQLPRSATAPGGNPAPGYHSMSNYDTY